MRAFFLVVLLGCSDPQPQFADAPVGTDAAIDAPIDAAIDAPEGNSVTVHVRRRLGDGMPDTAATVYLAAPDGTLRATVMPDAGGMARLDATAGDSVTVRAGGPGVELTTVGGVEPGDELWFGPPGLVPAGQMTLEVPVNADATGYRVFGPCMVPELSDVTTLQVQWWAGCPDTRTIIVVADGAGTGGIDQMFTTSVTFASGSTLELAGTWVDAVDVSLPLVGARPGIETEAVFVIGGELVIGLDAIVVESPPSVRWRRPATLDEGAYLHVRHGDGVQDDLQRVAPGATAVDVTTRVPAITDLVATPSPSWTVAAPDPIDAFYVETVAPAATWVFVLPPDARTLVRPQVPDAPPTVLEDLVVIDVAGAGYDDFRPQAGHRERFVNRHPPVGYDLQFRTASQ